MKIVPIIKGMTTLEKVEVMKILSSIMQSTSVMIIIEPAKIKLIEIINSLEVKGNK